MEPEFNTSRQGCSDPNTSALLSKSLGRLEAWVNYIVGHFQRRAWGKRSCTRGSSKRWGDRAFLTTSAPISLTIYILRCTDFLSNIIRVCILNVDSSPGSILAYRHSPGWICELLTQLKPPCNRSSSRASGTTASSGCQVIHD